MPCIPDLEPDFDDLRLPGLRQAFHWLGCRLKRAVASVQTANSAEAATDPYRGLYVGSEDVIRILARDPGSSTLQGDGDDTLESLPDSVLSAEPFSRLKPIVELCPFDMAVLVISIAPEYDLGYERLYAY